MMPRRWQRPKMDRELRYQSQTEHSARCDNCQRSYDPTAEGDATRCGLCVNQLPLPGLEDTR